MGGEVYRWGGGIIKRDVCSTTLRAFQDCQSPNSTGNDQQDRHSSKCTTIKLRLSDNFLNIECTTSANMSNHFSTIQS